MEYKQAWDYQEALLQKNIRIKSEGLTTSNYFLFVEHPPVYTLGKSGHMENILLVGSSRVDLQACKLEYSIVSPK